MANEILSSLDVLNALSNGIIDVQHIKNELDMLKRKEYLERHPYKMYEGKDGKFYTHLPDETKPEGRIKKVRNTRKELEDAVIVFWKKQEEDPTIEVIFNQWHDRRLELNKISKPSYVRMQNTFRKHFIEYGKYQIKNMGVFDWCMFLEEQLAECSLTSKGFSSLKTIVKGILKQAKRLALIDYTYMDVYAELDVSDAEFTKIVREDSDEIFTPEEMTKMMSYLLDNPDVKNYCLLLMFISGMRIGEAVVLSPNNIDMDCIHIRRTERSYKDLDGKGIVYEVKDIPKTAAGIRDIVIPESYSWLMKKIRTLNPFGEFVFMEKGKRVTSRALRSRLDRLCVKLNIPHKSPHKIRKTYCSILLDSGIADGKFVTDQMGHVDISTSEKYYHKNRKSIDTKKAILNQIAEFG